MTKSEVKMIKGWLKRIHALNCKFTIRPVQGDERYELYVCYNKSVYVGRILPNACTERGIKGFGYFVYSLMQEITLHEMNEFFTIDNKRVMNPHYTGYTRLIKF